MRRRIARPSVVLPEPDSPTTPSVSPCAHPQRHAVDRLDVADRALKEAALDRKPDLDRPCLDDDRRVRLAPGWRGPSARRRAGAACKRGCGLPKIPRPSPCSTISPLQHDADAVGDLAHDAEIVGDEEHRHVQPALELGEELRICACTVTSSAVVGSSAMRRSGSLASAMAIMTRWRCPPESWCG